MRAYEIVNLFYEIVLLFNGIHVISIGKTITISIRFICNNLKNIIVIILLITSNLIQIIFNFMGSI